MLSYGEFENPLPFAIRDVGPLKISNDRGELRFSVPTAKCLRPHGGPLGFHHSTVYRGKTAPYCPGCVITGHILLKNTSSRAVVSNSVQSRDGRTLVYIPQIFIILSHYLLNKGFWFAHNVYNVKCVNYVV